MNPRQQNIPSPNTKGNVPPSIPFVPYNSMPMFYAPNQAPTPLFGPAFPYHPVPSPMIIQPHPPQGTYSHFYFKNLSLFLRMQNTNSPIFANDGIVIPLIVFWCNFVMLRKWCVIT